MILCALTQLLNYFWAHSQINLLEAATTFSVPLTQYFSGDKIEMGWDGHVACMGGRVAVYTCFWWGNLSERDHLEDPGINGRVLLRWILREWDVGT